MTGIIFAVSFGLNFLLFSPCEGQISLPPGGSTFVVLPGENVKIAWKLGVSISRVDFQAWTFLPKNNGTFADITGDGAVVKKPQYSPGPITITKPSTVLLKNVTIQYNGTYIFLIVVASVQVYASEVTVFVAVAPTVTINCSSIVTVNEGDDFTCVCRGEGGNPPANVTWYDKDGVQIGGTGKEEQTLTLRNVDGTDTGTYKCVAESHTLAEEKFFEVVKVRLDYPPDLPYFKEKAVVGKTFAITCESNGHPPPSYTIIHNDTKVVSNDRTYTIDVVQYSDAGLYKCIAENKLGNSSTIYYLSILDQLINPTTGITTQNFPTTENSRSAANKEDDGTTVAVWHIVVSLASGIIIGILLSYIVLCSRRKFRSRKPQSNPEPKTTEADTTYQELDLPKMNTEDNYQSLRVNAASYDAGNGAGNDDDSTYTDLNKTRDVEDNYQSLT